MDDLGFWIGLATALPIAVIANLLTPPLSRTAAQYSNRIRKWRTGVTARQRKVDGWFTENPQHFTTYMVRALYSMIPNVLMLAAALAFYLMYFTSPDVNRLVVFQVAFLLIGLFSLYMVLDMMNTTRRVQTTWRGVRKQAGWPVTAQLQLIDSEEPETAGESIPKES